MVVVELVARQPMPVPLTMRRATKKRLEYNHQLEELPFRNSLLVNECDYTVSLVMCCIELYWNEYIVVKRIHWEIEDEPKKKGTQYYFVPMADLKQSCNTSCNALLCDASVLLANGAPRLQGTNVFSSFPQSLSRENWIGLDWIGLDVELDCDGFLINFRPGFSVFADHRWPGSAARMPGHLADGLQRAF